MCGRLVFWKKSLDYTADSFPYSQKRNQLTICIIRSRGIFFIFPSQINNFLNPHKDYSHPRFALRNREAVHSSSPQNIFIAWLMHRYSTRQKETSPVPQSTKASSFPTLDLRPSFLDLQLSTTPTKTKAALQAPPAPLPTCHLIPPLSLPFPLALSHFPNAFHSHSPSLSPRPTIYLLHLLHAVVLRWRLPHPRRHFY